MNDLASLINTPSLKNEVRGCPLQTHKALPELVESRVENTDSSLNKRLALPTI